MVFNICCSGIKGRSERIPFALHRKQDHINVLNLVYVYLSSDKGIPPFRYQLNRLTCQKLVLPGEMSQLPRNEDSELGIDTERSLEIMTARASLQLHKRSHKYSKRIALLCSSLAALASGTPYLYGVYSPQLINKCGFSALDSSYLSFSGNIGSSIGGFIAGLIIDKFGIKSGLLLGAILEFSGFFIFYINYKYAIHNFLYLLFAMCSIGFGSVLAYFATIKVATLNFPNHRGLANACPVSAYGLAALFYAFISTIWFADDIEGLLKFIAMFSGLTIAISSLFIKIYDDEEDDADNNDEEIGNYCNIVLHDDMSSDEGTQSSDENEFEVGINYLLKGHRGSFAQINNLLRNESSSSLFSDMTEASSLASTSLSSRNSSLVSVPGESLNSISITQSNLLRSNSNTAMSQHNNYVSSSPLDFKVKQQPFIRSGSFRMSSSFTNSPRTSRAFGSMNQKNIIKDMKQTPTEDFSILTTYGSENLNSSPMPLSSSPNNSTNTGKSFTDLKSLKMSSASNLLTSSHVPYTSNNSYNTNTLNNNTHNNNISDAKSMSATLVNDFIKNNTNGSKNHRKKKKALSPKEHVIRLLKKKVFLSLYVLNAFYCAIGQVYIFGIGYIVRAQVNYYREHNSSMVSTVIIQLAAKFSTSTTPSNLAITYQALQVSIISFANFLGRLISGPSSDLIHKKWKLSKIYVVVTSLIILTIGQISLLVLDILDLLSLTSFLIGLAYGSVYGVMPSIIADSFGSKNFATTWALLGTGPITVFLVLSDYFGVVYDSNSEWKEFEGGRIKMCMKGKGCYSDVFTINSASCILLFIGYIWLIMSTNKKK